MSSRVPRISLPSIVLLASLLLVPVSEARKGGGPSGIGQGDYVKTDLTEPDWKGAYYTVFLPKGTVPGRRYPLVFALHGNGQKSDGLVKNIAKVSTAEQPCYVVAPQYQQGNKFNDPRYPRSAELFRKVLDDVLAVYPIDEGRLVLQGFSMGGNYLCAWTWQWFTQDPDGYPFDMVWMSSTAVPPRDEEKAPFVPYVLMTGSKETAVMGVVNVVKMTRDCYRVLLDRGHDVRYVEIPGMGHAVNGRCIETMRDSLAGLVSYEESVRPVDRLPEAAAPAVARARAGRFAEALSTLEALAGEGSTLSSTERSYVRKQIRSIEKFLKSHAASEPKRLAGSFTPSAYDAFAALAVSLAEDESLGRAFSSALSKMEKDKALSAQLAARAEFEAARKLEDPAAARAALQALADGRLGRTVYAQRAREHLQATK